MCHLDSDGPIPGRGKKCKGAETSCFLTRGGPEPTLPLWPHGEIDWKVVLVGLGAHSSCDSDHPQTASCLCSQLFSELCLWLQDTHTLQSPSELDLTYLVCVCVCVCV